MVTKATRGYGCVPRIALALRRDNAPFTEAPGYRVIDQGILVALITIALTTSMFSGPVMQSLLPEMDTTSLDTRARQT